MNTEMSRMAVDASNGLILVVDDDRLIRALAREALENDGYSVIEAADGREALAICERSEPDLVLLELSCSESRGIEFCRGLRQRERECESLVASHTPILVMTSAQSVKEIREALDAGASDFINKPLSWRLLGIRVAYLMQASKDSGQFRRGAASLATAQRIAGIGSWEWRRTTKEMQWSPVVFEILGLDPEASEASYQQFWQSAHPEEREAAREEVGEALAAQGHFAIQQRIVLPSGRIRYVQLRGELIQGGAESDSCVAGTIQDITEQHDTETRNRYLANFDGLTGLANRRYFNEQLEKEIAESVENDSLLALLYIDLDRFKRLNDSLGHSVGDRIIQVVAQRLSEYVRLNDTLGRFQMADIKSAESETAVSRLGGDEFSILLPKILESQVVGEIAERLLNEITAPIRIDRHEVTVTASIGIAVFPDDAAGPDTLLQHADRAMYSVKQAGRNGYRFYQASMDAATDRRFLLERQLRHAIERDELQLYYQPKVDLASRRVIGMEGLLRWTNEELGAVSPTEFIPICEETGLILPIGEWVLRTACRQNKAWQEAGFEPIRVAVNASIVQFQRQNIGSVIAAVLQETRLDPSYLEIEITESVMLNDAEAIARELRDLRHIGVKIALDDFGTGYSSLSFIANFPLDSLKMDRSFVRDADSDSATGAITTAVISMAQGLGLKVVAEGVDLEAQAVFLNEQGCDEMQGFLFSGPVPAEEFEQFLISSDPVSSD
jgi:PAS domain S-box-containing protein